jgi:hypothetical protein
VSPFFERIVKWSANNIFSVQQPYTTELLSDSTGLYIHVFNLLVLSLIGSFILVFLGEKWRLRPLKYWFNTIVAYYLSLQLFIYGLNKVFKWQFYLPEPNTLYTTVGETHLDLLFWSTMGASYPYTVFSGIVEVIPACLLLFKRTRLLGAIIAFAVMVNVVLINFSFDISVKVFSLFLLLLSSVLVFPFGMKLYKLFIDKEAVSLQTWQPTFGQKQRNIYLIVKTLALVLIFFEVLSPYYTTSNYNDDTCERPALHGAYETYRYTINGETATPIITNKRFIKRVFVHRKGYFITQTATDKMQDYKLTYTGDGVLNLNNYYNNKNYILSYEVVNDSILYLKGNLEGKQIDLMAVKLNTEQLPLLQKEFNWTIDGY